MNNPQVAKAIAKLKEGSDGSRYRAIVALGQIGDPAVAPLLIETLKDERDILRIAVAQALSKLGVAAVPALITALKEKSVRSKAATVLGNIGDKSAVPALVEALEREGDWDLACPEAAEALGKIGDKSAVPALIEALKDDGVCSEAVKALGKIGDASAVPALIAVLEGGRDTAPCGADEALGAIFDKSALPILIEALQSKNVEVRLRAAQALETKGDVTAVPALLEALEGEKRQLPVGRQCGALLLEIVLQGHQLFT